MSFLMNHMSMTKTRVMEEEGTKALSHMVTKLHVERGELLRYAFKAGTSTRPPKRV